MGRRYEFDSHSYAAMAAAEVGWREVLDALHGPGQKILRPVGGHGLQVVARVPDNGWLAMDLSETAEDEVWVLTAVQRLDTTESTTLDAMFGRGDHE